MWNEFKEWFSQGNTHRVHQLKKEISRQLQGGDKVVTYYTKLKSLWDKLDDYVKVHECTCSAALKQAKEKEVEKLHQFLMGLDTELFKPVCSQILNMEPLPVVSKAFSMVNQEEKCKLMSKKEEMVEAVAFLVGESADGQQRFGLADRPICNYCHRTGHVKETCWQLHGRPANWQPRPST